MDELAKKRAEREDMKDGVRKIVEAEKRERETAVGSNGGVLCDVRSGPCSCGAWH